MNSWWWYKKVIQDARIFGLINEEENSKLRKYAIRYDSVLAASVTVIAEFWHTCISKEYKADQSITLLQNKMVHDFDSISYYRWKVVDSISTCFNPQD